MKHMTHLGAVGSALAVAGVLAFGGQAAAEQVNADVLDLTNYPEWANVKYHVTYSNGESEAATTYAGLWYFGQNSGPLTTYSGSLSTQEFLSFCIDIDDTTSIPDLNQVYDVLALQDSPDERSGPMGATRANTLLGLLGTFIGPSLNNAANAVSGGNVNGADYSAGEMQAAMQIAVWEAVHDDNLDIATKGLSSGVSGISFTNMTVNVSNLAQYYLDNIDASKAMSGLRGLSNVNGKQDFIAQVVPIPAAAWLFGSALLGMAGIGYRRSGAPRSV